MVIRRQALVVVLALAACNEAIHSPNALGTVEIFSWWVSGGEQAALKGVLADYGEKHPTVSVINAAEQNSKTARAALTTRMRQGNPPDTFQVNGGVQLVSYVVTNGQDASQSKLETIDTIPELQNYALVIPSAVMATVSYKEHVYAVPVDIGRVNALFYNKVVFARNNLEPPRTVAQFIAVSDALRTAGVIPLAVGDMNPWTLEVIMKGCMAAEGGSDYYKSFVSGQSAYFSGTSSTPDNSFDAAIADFGNMMAYANTTDMRALTWDQAVGRVVTGRAAMTIMGDWALGEFIHQGMRPDIDFGEVPAPGSGGTFIFTTDTFVLPKGAKNRDGAVMLLSEFASLRGQAAFNPLKGSISPRTDADPGVYNSISQKTLQEFHTVPLVGDFALTVPQEFVDAFDAALDQFASDGIAQNVVLAVKNYYDTLVVAP